MKSYKGCTCCSQCIFIAFLRSCQFRRLNYSNTSVPSSVYINMIFKLAPAFGVILLASHVCCPPTKYHGIDAPLPAALNVDRKGLYDYKIGLFRDLSWEDFATAILGQKGSLIPRDKDVAGKLELSMKADPTTVYEKVLQHVGWYPLDENVGKGLFLWDSDVVADVKGAKIYTKLLQCEFPYSIPKGVTHYIDWFRVGFLDDDSFKSIGITDPQRVQALKEYIDFYDFYGHYGLLGGLANLRGDQKALFAHPEATDFWTSTNGQKVTRDEGIAAIEAAGKRINDHLKLTFPEARYQVVWNRAPTRWKSITGPDHFHVFVYPKALRFV